MKRLAILGLLLTLLLAHAAAEGPPSCRVWVNGQQGQTVYQTRCLTC